MFDGLQSVAERCNNWYEGRLRAETAGKMIRGDEKESHRRIVSEEDDTNENDARSSEANPSPLAVMPQGVQITEAEPITDRKSVFVGRACRISDPSQVSHARFVNAFLDTNYIWDARFQLFSHI